METKSNIPITGIVITHNEEKQIKLCLNSLSWCTELIVVDSFSTDSTPKIIKGYQDVKLYQRPFLNHADQKNWAIEQANNNWIFILDADEVATDPLIEEIKIVIASQDTSDAYWIGRRNFLMGKELKNVWKNDAVIRLFQKKTSKYSDVQVHEEIETTGNISRLKNKIIHDTYKGIDIQLSKAHQYTTKGALDRVDRVKNIGIYHLLVKPGFTFFKHYFIKKGFLDGIPGLFVSAQAAWNAFERSIKIWRYHQGEDIK